MNNYYVYEWYRTDTHEVFYVGKGSGKRYLQVKGRSEKFLAIYNSAPCESKIIYSGLEEEDAYCIERNLIRSYLSRGIPLANIAEGGAGSRGTKLTEECKLLHSEKSKEKWKDTFFRQKQLQLRHDPNGPYKNALFREKISYLVQGSKNPNYGNFWTKEQKERLRQIQKSNSLYHGATNPNAHSVVCLETNTFYPCIIDACNDLNIKSPTSITVCLRESNRTAGGYHWVKSHQPLSKDECFTLLLNAIVKGTRCSSVICLETKQIFQTRKLFEKQVGIFSRKAPKELKLGTLSVGSLHYMYVRDYVKSPLVETLSENPE